MAISTQEKGTANQYVKGQVVGLNGASMVAEAMRQMNPDVVAAYPITPQTLVVEAFSQFVANGEVDTEFIAVESEHAALSTCVGASAAGGRAQTATAGAGMALMWEIMWCASGMRLPIVMHVVNRSLSGPLNILCDHTDVMGARDTGWIQLFAEDGQEAYDNAIQCVRIAEHPDIMLPVLHGQDGYTISHSVERGEVLPDDVVKKFVGTYRPKHSLLDVDHPATFGPNDYSDFFALHKRQQYAALDNALRVIPEIGQEFGRLTGRYYGLVEEYHLSDAEVAIVVIGSTAGAIKDTVDELRDSGVKAGVLKIRCYRPFPAAAVARALAGKKAIAVMDRCTCFGAEGNPLFLDVSSALFARGQAAKVVNYIYGLGGRDTVPAQVKEIYQELMELASGKGIGDTPVRFLGIED